MYTASKSKSVKFRLSEDDLNYINWLSLQYNCSLSEVLRKLVRHYRSSSEDLYGNTITDKFDSLCE